MSSNMVSLHLPEEERSLIFAFIWMIKTRVCFVSQNTLNNDFNLIDLIEFLNIVLEQHYATEVFLNVFQKHKTMSRKMLVELILSITIL